MYVYYIDKQQKTHIRFATPSTRSVRQVTLPATLFPFPPSLRPSFPPSLFSFPFITLYKQCTSVQSSTNTNFHFTIAFQGQSREDGEVFLLPSLLRFNRPDLSV